MYGSCFRKLAVILVSDFFVLVIAREKHTYQPNTSIKYFFFPPIILVGYGHIGKWIQENKILMRFCHCFKLSKKIEKLSNK